MAAKRATGNQDSSTIAKSLTLLQALAAQDTAPNQQELAHILALPKTNVHRLTNQLRDLGYLRRSVGSNGLAVTPKLRNFALSVLSATAAGAPCRMLLKSISERLGECCNLSILDGGDLVCLASVASQLPVTLQFKPGDHVPLHATGSGKIYLAWMPPHYLEPYLKHAPLKRFTESTITDPEALRRELSVVRKRGIALSNEEWINGVIGYAVPVLSEDECLAAALSISIPRTRFAAAQSEEIAGVLKDGAARLAGMFGRIA